MSGPRNIRVALTHDEYAALQRTVSGELESLTESDEESGVYDDLHAAQSALHRAWSKMRAREQEQKP